MAYANSGATVRLSIYSWEWHTHYLIWMRCKANIDCRLCLHDSENSSRCKTLERKRMRGIKMPHTHFLLSLPFGWKLMRARHEKNDTLYHCYRVRTYVKYINATFLVQALISQSICDNGWSLYIFYLHNLPTPASSFSYSQYDICPSSMCLKLFR